jgi:hypothetical protein
MVQFMVQGQGSKSADSGSDSESGVMVQGSEKGFNCVLITVQVSGVLESEDMAQGSEKGLNSVLIRVEVSGFGGYSRASTKSFMYSTTPSRPLTWMKFRVWGYGAGVWAWGYGLGLGI